MANTYDFTMPLDYSGFKDNSSSIANRYNPFWDAEANISLNDIAKGNIASNASNLQRQNYQVVPHAVSEAPSYAMYGGHLADPVIKPSGNADEFVKTYLPYAQKIEEAYGIPAPLVLAQAAHETGYGRALRDNNFFGIKGSGTAGSKLWNTHEYANGNRMNVRDKFAGYETVEDSFNAYGKLISGKRYRDAMSSTHDPRAYFDAIQGAGYATDPNYANKVYEVYKGIMRRLG